MAVMIMTYALTLANVEDPEGKVFTVRSGRRVVGWVQHLTGGWRRYGYTDEPPVLPSSREAVSDLVHFDHAEQREDWPEVRRAICLAALPLPRPSWPAALA